MKPLTKFDELVLKLADSPIYVFVPVMTIITVAISIPITFVVLGFILFIVRGLA